MKHPLFEEKIPRKFTTRATLLGMHPYDHDEGLIKIVSLVEHFVPIIRSIMGLVLVNFASILINAANVAIKIKTLNLKMIFRKYWILKYWLFF